MPQINSQARKVALARRAARQRTRTAGITTNARKRRVRAPAASYVAHYTKRHTKGRLRTLAAAPSTAPQSPTLTETILTIGSGVAARPVPPKPAPSDHAGINRWTGKPHLHTREKNRRAA